MSEPLKVSFEVIKRGGEEYIFIHKNEWTKVIEFGDKHIILRRLRAKNEQK